ncbi:hypothetical protein CBS147353_11692 [Aspergillus niger]|nr:hypothetical protein CBS147353_11692 [Aspergillus niger]
MSEPPPPYFQAWFMPGTGCEELSQHLPCISDGLPQASGKLAVSFDQPVPVLAFAANDPYYLVPQPIHDNTQAHEDKLIPEEDHNADHTKPETLCRKTGLLKSSCFEAQIMNGQAKYAATRSQNPCLPCPLSELNDGMQDIPVRDILSGQSWKMEAAHIREKYETLAEMEKQNHARAHPGYRFSLSSKRGKPRTAKGHSRELTLRSKAFSKLGQNPQPTACGNTAYNARATAQAHPSQTSSFVAIGTFAGIPMLVTEAMSESVYGSSCDESDFLTLFNEPKPLENPTPSVSWVEAEMAKMEAKDQHGSQHYEFVSDDLSLRDRQMTGPSLDYVSCLTQGTNRKTTSIKDD